MEPFLLYVMVCLASTGACNDYGPTKYWVFQSQADCTVLANKMLITYRKKFVKRGDIYVDGIAFCLKATEERET